VAFDDLAQRPHHGSRAFIVHQLGRNTLHWWGIIQDHQQIVPTVFLEPLVMTTVDMQQHSWQWTARSFLAMHSAIAGFGD
jgi:hypothetical protein